MAATNVLILTEKNFKEQVLQAPVPVLVDFWAEWCGPCKMMAPLFDELAGEYDGRVRFGKVNTEDNQSIAAEYGIRGIPTFLLFQFGEVVDQIVGARSKRDFKTMLEEVIH